MLSSFELIQPTTEAVFLNAISGVIAQALNAYRRKSLVLFDHASIVQFIIYTAITAAPNFVWQDFLEATFPTMTARTLQKANSSEREHYEERLDVGNTIKKFLLDQSLGSAVNTLLFISIFGGFQGKGLSDISADVYLDFWSLLFAGYRLWPFVCLLNLVIVPMRYRPLIGNLAGLGWGVWLSLRTSA